MLTVHNRRRLFRCGLRKGMFTVDMMREKRLIEREDGTSFQKGYSAHFLLLRGLSTQFLDLATPFFAAGRVIWHAGNCGQQLAVCFIRLRISSLLSAVLTRNLLLASTQELRGPSLLRTLHESEITLGLSSLGSLLFELCEGQPIPP